MLEASGFATLTTALYPEGDEYIKSDAVFGTIASFFLRCILRTHLLISAGVKSSLICKLEAVYDDSKAKSLGFKTGPYWELKWDFVLQTTEQAEREKEKTLPSYYRFK